MTFYKVYIWNLSSQKAKKSEKFLFVMKSYETVMKPAYFYENVMKSDEFTKT